MSTPQEIVDSWRAGDSSCSSNYNFYSTAEGELYSDGLKIGHRTQTGKCIVMDLAESDWSYPDHIKLAKAAADLVMHPRVWEVTSISKERIPF